ncbi:MAG: glycyl-radical enzyme activating protein [Erysipelotrichaceae bacterium]
MSKGLVFDIKHFALHDGDGIRTTIFLKGCPLKCVWCQNPEGIDRHRKLTISKECVKCQNCIINSDGHIDKDYYIVEEDYDFSNLIKQCPTNALHYDSQYYEVSQLMDIIKKDQVFYHHNGGVSFSGGEPLMQSVFLKDMLMACKKEGINTCLETSAYLDSRLFGEIIEYVDILYIDFKIYNNDDHIKYVGVDNTIIKNNILYALNHHNNVIIRTPLIPHITASVINIELIVEYLYECNKDYKYELLNFNPLAKNKYLDLHKEYFLSEGNEMYNEEQMAKFKQIVREKRNEIINR